VVSPVRATIVGEKIVTEDQQFQREGPEKPVSMTRVICREMCGIDPRDLSPLQQGEPRLLDYFPSCASLVPALIQKLYCNFA